MNIPSVGVDNTDINFSCLDKFSKYFRGRNLSHQVSNSVTYNTLKQQNYGAFRGSLEEQFLHVDLDTAHQRYRELVRRHDSLEGNRLMRIQENDEMSKRDPYYFSLGVKRNLLFEALLKRDPYVGDYFQDILSLDYPSGMTSDGAWQSSVNEWIVRDYLKCVMSIIRQLRPEITNVALDEPMVGETPIPRSDSSATPTTSPFWSSMFPRKIGGKYKRRIRTKQRSKRSKRMKSRSKRFNKNKK